MWRGNAVELQPLEEGEACGKALCTTETGVYHGGFEALRSHLVEDGTWRKSGAVSFCPTEKPDCAERYCLIVYMQKCICVR